MSIVRPWVGVAAYYLMAICVPAAIWPWVFQGTRVSFYIAVSTIIGFVGAAMTNRVDFGVLKNKQNIYLFILWGCLAGSYLFGPYDLTETKDITRDPNYLLLNMSKVFLSYFLAILIFDSRRKLHFLIWVLLGSSIFFVYWGNMEYFNGRLAGLHYTLSGPGYAQGLMSVYIDENSFAMFYVISIPFLFFMGEFYKNKLLKYFLWANIPLAWHCIFLTGSRGGLIGLGIVSAFISIRSKMKLLRVAIPILLIIAVLTQSGPILQERVMRVANLGEQEGSAQARLTSWETGFKMITDHPITGVGIGNYLKAYPDYADTTPYVAHNTIIQFSAENGILAALMYLLLCFGIVMKYVKSMRISMTSADPMFLALGNAITGGVIGFFICALFLNLATYELFYYMLALHMIKSRLMNMAGNLENQIQFPERAR